MDEQVYMTFDEFRETFDCLVEEIDQSYIVKRDENGVWLRWTDSSPEDGIPDFMNQLLGIDVELNPSQGVAFG